MPRPKIEKLPKDKILITDGDLVELAELRKVAKRFIHTHPATRPLRPEDITEMADAVAASAGATKRADLRQLPLEEKTHAKSLALDWFCWTVINQWSRVRLPITIKDNEDGQSPLVHFANELARALGLRFGKSLQNNLRRALAGVQG